jgi:hypothetical protein
MATSMLPFGGSLDIDLLAVLESNTTSSDSWFGYAVSTSGDTIVVGDHYDDNSSRQEQYMYLWEMELPGLNKPISKPVILEKMITLAYQWAFQEIQL